MEEKKPELELEEHVTRMQRDVTEIQRCLENFQKTSRRMKNAQLGITVAVVLIVGSFLFGLYKKVVHFDTTKTQELMLQKMREDLPLFTQKIVQMSERIIPVYLQQGKIALQASIPQFSSIAEKETNEFARYLEEDMTVRVKEGILEILKSQEYFLYNVFPEFQNDENIVLLSENLHDILKTALEDVLIDKFAEHLSALEGFGANLERFKEEIEDEPVEENLELKLMATTFELLGKKLTLMLEE
jgi:hypothetical protein